MSQTKMNLSYIKEAISATQQLRSTVTNVFTFLCDGFKAEEEYDGADDASTSLSSNSISKDPKKFLFRFQNYLQAVNQDYNEVEKLCNSMTTNAEITALGPSGFLSQDSVFDKTGLYRSVWLNYQWFHKLHEYSQLTASTMNSSSIRKSQSQTGQSTPLKKLRPSPQRFHAVISNTQHIDQLLHSLSNQMKDSALKIIQVSGDVRVLQMVVGRVLNAFIVLRCLHVEQILVKGQGEEFHNEDGTVDLFTSSQFESMRIITEHATSAIFEYLVPHSSHPELTIRYVLHWLQYYRNLFTEKCSICGKHLSYGLPPLWIDYRNFSACHDACKS